MELRENTAPVPGALVASCAAVALTLGYSAPTPGTGSRYVDGGAPRMVAHEARLLSAAPVGEALAAAGRPGVGAAVLEAVLGSHALTGYADPRTAGYLAPQARAALLGEPVGKVLARMDSADVPPFTRAFEVAGPGFVDGPFAGALRVARRAGANATLADAARFVVGRDPLAREYARNYEVTRELARPALLSSLSRVDSARGALVQAYLEVLSEVPDLDVVERAGRHEADDVSRMARGVIKAGGVHSRRGVQAVANLDGLLREDGRLVPSATEPAIIAAAFLVALEHGPDALGRRLRPATGRDGGR